MKNILRTAQRELKSLEKKQSQIIGRHRIDIYLDYNRPNQKYKPLVYLTTIRNIPDNLFRRLQQSKYYTK